MSAVVREGTSEQHDVELVPMRRRHVRAVLRIEAIVYPRPWSASLFLQEIARRTDRHYLVARAGSEVVGYAGMMITGTEGHVTTIAVDPDHQRRKIGMKLLIALFESAIERGCRSMSLEVRKSNLGAQRLYERFGFRPVGIRPGYYIETNEDAVVMWVDNIDSSNYSQLLEQLGEVVGD